MTTVRPDTQHALLDAAESVFAAKGFDGASTREIVELAGVNIAAIRYHFGSKRDLYLAAVRRAMEDRGAGRAWLLLQGPDGEPPATPHEAMIALVRFCRAFLEGLLHGDEQQTSCLVLAEATHPSEAIDAVVESFIRPHHRMLTRVLQVIRPGATTDGAGLDAQAILGQLLHYRMSRPFVERLGAGSLDDPAVVRTVADHVARFSLAGLGAERSLIDAAVTAANDAMPDPRPVPTAAPMPPVHAPNPLPEETS